MRSRSSCCKPPANCTAGVSWGRRIRGASPPQKSAVLGSPPPNVRWHAPTHEHFRARCKTTTRPRPKRRSHQRVGRDGKRARAQMVRQQREILHPRRQTRDVDFNHRQTPEQILTEPTPCDQLVQIRIAGGQHPHITRSSLLRTHWFEGAFLQNTEQPSLQCWRSRVDFVQKEGAPSANSNRPRRSRSAPVKAPRTCPNNSDSRSSSPKAAARHFDERSTAS